jgi:hypothetical protein
VVNLWIEWEEGVEGDLKNYINTLNEKNIIFLRVKLKHKMNEMYVKNYIRNT